MTFLPTFTIMEEYRVVGRTTEVLFSSIFIFRLDRSLFPGTTHPAVPEWDKAAARRDLVPRA